MKIEPKVKENEFSKMSNLEGLSVLESKTIYIMYLFN